MRIFVTVGNTHYNGLIKAVDEQFANQDIEVVLQIADGQYLPKNHHYFQYTSDIEGEFARADVVITHAGAGTIFELLDKRAKVVVVPNFERIDSHQKDLADYVKNQGYAEVCECLEQLEQSVNNAMNKSFNIYKYEAFFGFDLIAQTLGMKPVEVEQVAGIPVNLFPTIKHAVDFILDDHGNPHFGSAIAINPEKIIYSLKDPQVNQVLMNASIRFADGIGVVTTLKRKTSQQVARIPGCELWEEVMEKAGKTGAEVFLVGAKAQVIEATKSKLAKDFGVNVVGSQDGYFTDEQALIEQITSKQPKVVTVALGSPRQEKFIAKCREKWPSAFYMGVGGTYDVFTENVKRAPAAYRRLNLEWFYRLISEPKRIFRQTNLLTYLWLELSRKL